MRRDAYCDPSVFLVERFVDKSREVISCLVDDVPKPSAGSLIDDAERLRHRELECLEFGVLPLKTLVRDVERVAGAL